MKLIHTADLHIGRRMYEFDLIEDQRHILQQILDIAAEERADGLILAGDIYDRSVPSAEAVSLFDRFLTRANEMGLSCYIISGNHDSAERLSFAGEILGQKHIYIGSSWKQGPFCVSKTDAYGEVNIWLLPFVRPARVKAWRLEQEADDGEAYGNNGTAQEAMEYLLSLAEVDIAKRNVLAAHCFAAGDGAEMVSAGGIDHVRPSCFAAFDYTALGHLHQPGRVRSGQAAPEQAGDRQVAPGQTVAGQVWYAGSPLCYSFGEARPAKSVQVIELKEKGNLTVRQCPLTPLHEVRRLTGTLQELLEQGNREKAEIPERTGDYICAVLTDQEELLDPAALLRGVYPHLCEIVIQKHMEAAAAEKEIADFVQEKSDQELFEEFYRKVTGQELDEAHRQVVDWMVEQAKEEER